MGYISRNGKMEECLKQMWRYVRCVDKMNKSPGWYMFDEFPVVGVFDVSVEKWMFELVCMLVEFGYVNSLLVV